MQYTWQVKPHVWEVAKKKAIAMGCPYERDTPAINGPMPGEEVARDVEFCGWKSHEVDVREEAPEDAAYRAYVGACLEENLSAHSRHMWEVHGCPAGPLG